MLPSFAVADNILIIQTGFIGDTILTTPLIDAVKNLHGTDTRITLLSTKIAKQLFLHDSRLSELLFYDKKGDASLLKTAKLLKEKQFTHAYLPHKSMRSAILAFLARIPHRIGFRGGLKSFLYTSSPGFLAKEFHEVDRKLSLVLPREQLAQGHCYAMSLTPAAETPPVLQSVFNTDKKIAVIGPTSVWRTKQWSTEGFHAIAKYLLSQRYRVVISGAPGDEETCQQAAPKDPEVFNLCGITNITDLSTLVSKASLVVCNDSALCHVASSYKVPTVVVFCATDSSQGFGPYKNPRSIIIEDKELWCRPCGRHGHHDCPTGTFACIKNVTAAHVVKGIEKVLA